jgi:hypothetical protein
MLPVVLSRWWNRFGTNVACCLSVSQ